MNWFYVTINLIKFVMNEFSTHVNNNILMICFPNAKINLGLNIVNKRPDGYHNIETIFYPIPVKDALEIVPAETTALQSP